MGERRVRQELETAAIVFATVLSAALFGILTRPLGFLAAFWPANAVLLGLFVRCPRLETAAGWLAAVFGYYAADLVTGGDLLRTSWLTAANLSGVAVGVALFGRLSEEDRRLRRPLSVLFLFAITAAAAAAAALVGAPAAPVFFDKDIASGAAFWFATELANAIIVLPVILTVPWPPRWPARRPALPRLRRPHDLHVFLQQSAPAAGLAVSLILGLLVGGPAAVTFPAPALLWCALTYPLFASVVLTMLVSIWHLIATSLGLFSAEMAHLDGTTSADRLAIMLLALGPLTAASINAARDDLLRRLEKLATYDALTGALTRAAFLERARRLFLDPASRAPLAVLMLDIDRFKLINDTHGHAAGDKALAAVADAIGRGLRDTDPYGRMGGEEFAIILPRTSGNGAEMVAERLRSSIAATAIPIGNPVPLRLTVSIGVAYTSCEPPMTLEGMLGAADRAMYRAKTSGRDRVVRADEETERAADDVSEALPPGVR